MELFWELHQSNQISNANRDASSARHKANEAMARLVHAERRAEKALLLCEALWTLLRDHLNLSDEQLSDRIRKLDMTDGKLDGKVRREPKKCPACNRVTPQHVGQCLYCGEELSVAPFSA